MYLVVIFMICTYLCTKIFNLVILLGCKLDYRDQLGVQLNSYFAEGVFINTVSNTITDRFNTLESLESGSLSLGLALRQVIRISSHGRIPGFLWMWSWLLFGVSAGVNVI